MNSIKGEIFAQCKRWKMEKQFAEDPCDAINLVLNNRKFAIYTSTVSVSAKISFKGICEKVINIKILHCHWIYEKFVGGNFFFLLLKLWQAIKQTDENIFATDLKWNFIKISRFSLFIELKKTDLHLM